MCLKLKVGSPAKRPGVGLDQFLALQRAQPLVELRPVLAAQQLEGRPARERPPHHRGRLDHGALGRIEPVDPRGQQGLDGGRHRQLALVDHHAHELLDEQRVALAGGERPLGQVGGHLARRRSGGRSARGSRPRSGARARASCRRTPGRASSRSLRATATSRIGTSLTAPARYSTSSRKVCSPQWTSSNKTTSGCRAAAASRSLRTAQKVSSGEAATSDSPRAPATRSTTTAVSSSSGSIRAIAACASSVLSPSWMPARPSTTSRTGQKVRPSPYDTQWPATTAAEPRSVSANSCVRRDLPSPAGPRTVTSSQLRVGHRAVEGLPQQGQLALAPHQR